MGDSFDMSQRSLESLLHIFGDRMTFYRSAIRDTGALQSRTGSKKVVLR